ncbi:MAG TPA: immunoglobulin domain-containing protein [Verrucomicrobiae bacterium]|nr:immunoglobulin domain-containing protein [Verrucomicrobiae bacterium]
MATSVTAAPRLTLSPHHVPEAVANLQPIGRLPASDRLDIAIGLPLRNQDIFSNLLEQLYDPTSTNYHHFLDPQQFTDMFGPAPEDYQALINFAQSHGLMVKKTRMNRALLMVNGSVSNIEQAFHITMRVYQHPTENRTFYAPDVEPTLDFNVPVLCISGLDNWVVPHPMSLHIQPAASRNFATYTGSGPTGAFIGNDFRSAYVPNLTLTGTGQSVALVEFDAYYGVDITNYETLAHLPNVTLTNITPDGPITPGSGNSEVALDIEMAISMAPGLSKVLVYEGTVTDDILSQIAQDDSAAQISASWSYGIDANTDTIFQQYQMQGQSFFNASGDSGAYVNSKKGGGNPVPTPCDDPNITIVGGTTLTTIANGGPYVSEVVWNWFTSGLGKNASSGGVSSRYTLPSWQSGISMSANQGSTAFRNLPDVALTGDNVWVNYNNGGNGVFGGTSCATPLWAAFMALVNQHAHQFGLTNAGFINPVVYNIGKGTNYLADFHDIINGSNSNQYTTNYPAVTNYDLCTGWGTPNGAAMISALSEGSVIITAQPTNFVTSPGSNAAFSISAFGTPIRYQWKFNGANISSATNSSYIITNAQIASQGTYAVVVSNSVSSVTSSNVTLVVNAPPTINGQPQPLTVAAGNNATFTVTASGSPSPTYQWQFNGTNIALATGTSYTVTNAQFTNQGNYSVLVSNAGGTVPSSNAFLTVNAAPMITQSPLSHSYSQGFNFSLVVGVNGSSPLFYQWVYNGANIPGATNAIYSITNLQYSQQGNYWALVSNPFGSATSAVAVVTVKAPPMITSQPQSLSLVAGNSAGFSVGATGSTPLGFQWYLNSSPLSDNGRITGSQTANLVITNLLVADAGNYQVMITNAYGSSNSAAAALSVSKATPVITWTNPPALVYGAALSSIQLNATANLPGTFAYNPPAATVLSAGTNMLSTIFTPTDTANYNSATDTVLLVVAPAPLTVTVSNATRLFGQSNPTFTASIVGVTNGDNLTASANCTATSTNLPGTYPIVPSVNDPNHRLGNYTVTYVNGTLTISPAAPPLITSIVPNTGSTNGGDTVMIIGTNFEMGATVNFGLFAATSVNVTNATNIIVTTPAEVAGAVDVIVTNTDGQSFDFTNGFTFVVPNQPAQIVSGPTNQTVSPGGNANFAATASGTSPLFYQWLFNTGALSGATNSNLALANVQAPNAGFYQLVVSNAFGASTSSIATLSVLGTQVSFVPPNAAQYTNGHPILQLTGLTGQGPVVIQSSTNLANWISIYTNPPGFGQMQFTDTNAVNLPRIFYRAITPAAP